MTEKKKFKPITFKQIKKSEKMVIKEDANTFYVKSSDPKKEPYFVYHDLDDRWLCDCMNFVMNLPVSGRLITHKCKHINMVLALNTT